MAPWRGCARLTSLSLLAVRVSDSSSVYELDREFHLTTAIELNTDPQAVPPLRPPDRPVTWRHGAESVP